jgi:ABC-type Fe3+-hydroxamate transport system substrate-binding protein
MADPAAAAAAAPADDLGVPLPRSGPVGRVVSLVPSLTESLVVTRPEALVGATDWCTHPPGLEVTRVRGTKNPDVARIVALAPQLVVANKEENRELDVLRLREAGIPVWVTDIQTVPQALGSLTRMFEDGLGWEVPSWLEDVRRAWDRPVPTVRARVAVPIWRDPWMVVGRDTFTSDLLRRLGYANVFADADARYPKVEVAEVDRPDVDLVLLPDEPYVFTADDGPEAFSVAPTRLVSGRMLTWYGPSLLEAAALSF